MLMNLSIFKPFLNQFISAGKSGIESILAGLINDQADGSIPAIDLAFTLCF